VTPTVCPHTFISLILCSIMMECRDLVLNNLPDFKVRWVTGLFELMARDSHPRSLPPLRAEPTPSESSPFINKVVINKYKNISVNMREDSSRRGNWVVVRTGRRRAEANLTDTLINRRVSITLTQFVTGIGKVCSRLCSSLLNKEPTNC